MTDPSFLFSRRNLMKA